MPHPMDHGYPIEPKHQCEAKVKNSYRRCKKPAIVDSHFCAYHSGVAGPRFDPFREVGEEALEGSEVAEGNEGVGPCTMYVRAHSGR